MAEEGRLQMCGVSFTFDTKIKVSAFSVQKFDKAVAWLPTDSSVHLSCEQ